MSKQKNKSAWKKGKVPRGKNHNKTTIKTTVSLYLNRNLVKKAREHRLNLSRVMEQALNSILDYLKPQKPENTLKFLNQCSFVKKIEWTERDLNPRPPPCEGGDHTNLIYRPLTTI